jgi:hypothetical protein
MPADRHLNTVLQLFQDVHDDAKTSQILGSTRSLLTTLSNPLNISVLTSQFLTAPAIWQRQDGLLTCVRVISIYNTAAIRVRDSELENATRRVPPQGGGLSSNEWTRSVAKGADDRSSRWQHLLVLTGVLIGMEGDDRRSLSRGLRNTLEQAVVTAVNLALVRPMQDGPIGAASIVLALNYALPLLSDYHKSLVNCDALLPIAVWSITSEHGFQDLAILGPIDADIRQTGGSLHWSPSSPSFQLLSAMEARPLMGIMGPLARLTGYTVQQARDPRIVLEALDSLMSFTHKTLDRWQANRFSEIESLEERVSLGPETLQITWPALWQFLKKALCSVVVVLQAIVSRSLLEPHLRSDAVAPSIAAKTLHALRDLFFISSRPGNGDFPEYLFTYLTSLDIIARYPVACTTLLAETVPPISSAVSRSCLRRTLDLFHLNVSEHLPLIMPPEMCDTLIVQPATVYISYTGPHSPHMVELFEAAHSAILSVLACLHNSAMAVNIIPFYVDNLFSSFPSRISTRQFCLAFKTVTQIVSPPHPISATHPNLSETLLEMVHFRAMNANTLPLPPPPDLILQADTPPSLEPMSEQSSLVLTLIDSLPFLPLPLVEDWLTLTAQALDRIQDPILREPVKKRFWNVLVSGEMDVERAAIGVAWWGTKGGRELVLGLRPPEQIMMSGAIVDEARSSRL